MAVFTLSKAFRRLNIFRKEIIAAPLSTQGTELSKVNPIFLQPVKPTIKLVENNLTFTARSVGLTFDVPRTRFPLSKIIDCPIVPGVQIDEPLKNEIEKSDITPDKVVEVPAANIIEKKAHRLIVIRRKKMKKHKRRKYLKKMKYTRLKRQAKKDYAREKAYQGELQEMITKANSFDAREYVAEKLNILKRKRLPTKWRGEIIPESMILQFIKEAKERKAYKHKLHNYRLKLD